MRHQHAASALVKWLSEACSSRSARRRRVCARAPAAACPLRFEGPGGVRGRCHIPRTSRTGVPMSKHNKAHTAAFKSTVARQQALTVYQGFGIVQETRENVQLQLGLNEVQLEGMPQQYMPNSLQILSHRGADVTIHGVSFRGATLSGNELLARLEGADVELKMRTNTGRERWASGVLKHYLGDRLVLSKPDGSHSLVTTGDVVEVRFEGQFPEGLSRSNSLIVTLDATAPGDNAFRILYHTRGLSWQALHKAVYDEKAGLLRSFNSWAGVDNRSGASYDGARLTLLAGNVQGAQLESASFAAMPMAAMAGGGAKRAGARRAETESVGEQKAYLVPGDFSIGANESKQVPLFNSADVPVTREYFVPPMPLYARSQQPDGNLEPVQIRLRLTNTTENHLGSALPAGEVDIYQEDSHGDAQLTGSAQIDHVAAGETFGFVIGSSTDIKAERKLIANHTAPGAKAVRRRAAEIAQSPAAGAAANDEDAGPKFHDETWEVIVHNFKEDGEVEVSVIEDFPAKHEILAKSHEFRQERSNRYSAAIKVPANDKATFRYTVRIWEE